MYKKNIDNENKYVPNNQVISVDDLDLQQNCMICIASKRMSGKSVLTRNLIKLLFDKHEYEFILLFSDTARFNEDYNFLDRRLIYTSDQIDDKVEKLLKIQEKNIKGKKIIHGLLILDDVKTYARSKQLIRLSTTGRHFKLSVIASVQYCKELISSSIRSNIDYFFWSDLNENALRSVYESIHVPMNFKTFQKFVDENNTNYQFLLYDSKEKDKKNRLKIIRATEYENIKLTNK